MITQVVCIGTVNVQGWGVFKNKHVRLVLDNYELAQCEHFDAQNEAVVEESVWLKCSSTAVSSSE